MVNIFAALKGKFNSLKNILNLNLFWIPQQLKIFEQELSVFKEKNEDPNFTCVEKKPMIYDKFEQAGTIDPHYYLQDIYIAKKIAKTNVKNHFDIGSRVDGFISHLLCFDIDVTIIDIRPLPQTVSGMKFIESNATELSQIADNSISSISALHSIEHFGLGRYGDPIDPDGWKKALYAMQRVLANNGKLYVSVPISNNNIVYFNSHRIFSPKTIIESFNELTLVEFSYIQDFKISTLTGNNIVKDLENINFTSSDCGMFIFEKK